MKYLFLSFCLFLLFLSNAQDSQKSISELFEQAEAFLPDSPDSSFVYLNAAEKKGISESSEDYARLLYLKGRAYSDKNEYDESNKYYAEARKNTKSAALNAELCLYEGINSLFKSEVLVGSEQLICAVDYFEQFGDKYKSQLVLCYGNLGFVKQRMGKSDEAYDYFQKSLAITEKNTRPYFALQINMGTILISQKEFEKSNEWHQNLVEPIEASGYEGFISALYANLCVTNTELGNHEKALYYGRKGVQKYKNDISLRILGEAFSRQEMYDSSLVYLLQVQNAANGRDRKKVLLEIARCYEGLGKPELATKFLRKRITLGDSLAKEELERKVELELAPYEAKKKEEQINQLNAENETNRYKLKLQKMLLGAALFTFGLLALLTYGYTRYQAQQQSLKDAHIQNKLLRSQLNPHFLFHSLQNIQNFIFQNEKDKSLKYLKNYSRLIRSVFDTSEDDFITIEEDAETVKDYLDLQQLNYDHSFRIDFHVDESIKEYSIPPLIVQPFVENSIIHGLRNLEEDGYVAVHYLDRDSKVSVVIEDNGSSALEGSDGLKLNKYSSTKVIEKRVEELAKAHQFNLNIERQNDDDGYRVIITFDKAIKQ